MKTAVLNPHRIRTGRLASDDSFGFTGAFRIPLRYYASNGKERFNDVFVVASDGMGWQHVSVSIVDKDACPSWELMCQVKALFWDAEDTVIQFHPAASANVNNHPHCLHLWKPLGVELPLPSPWMVGVPATHEVVTQGMEVSAALAVIRKLGGAR